MSIILRFDGSSKGNPGPGGSAAVLFKDQEVLDTCYYYHSKPVTCNIAEYYGLIGGLHMALSHGYKHLFVEGDSKLVMEQVFGTWKCEHKNMVPLQNEVKQLKKQFPSIYGRWIPREQNTEADRLSNVAVYQKENKGQLHWFQTTTSIPKRKTILEAFGIQ
jgi:ribonuclease HI